MRSAVSPVASLMIMTVFIWRLYITTARARPRTPGAVPRRATGLENGKAHAVGRSVIDHARALGIRSGQIAADVRADDLAAAATQAVIAAARAGLARVAPF